MKLSKTSAQAALAMGILAKQDNGQFLQARQIAEYLEIQTVSALKILQTLARHRLIESQLGRRGGYRMRIAPDDVTLLQVVEAMEGPICGHLRMKSTPTLIAGAVERLGKVCQAAAMAIREQLATTTIADLQHAS